MASPLVVGLLLGLLEILVHVLLSVVSRRTASWARVGRSIRVAAAMMRRNDRLLDLTPGRRGSVRTSGRSSSALLLEGIIQSGITLEVVGDQLLQEPARGPVMVLEQGSILFSVPLADLLESNLLLIVVVALDLLDLVRELLAHLLLGLRHLLILVRHVGGHLLSVLLNELRPLHVAHDNSVVNQSLVRLLLIVLRGLSLLFLLLPGVLLFSGLLGLRLLLVLRAAEEPVPKAAIVGLLRLGVLLLDESLMLLPALSFLLVVSASESEVAPSGILEVFVALLRLVGVSFVVVLPLLMLSVPALTVLVELSGFLLVLSATLSESVVAALGSQVSLLLVVVLLTHIAVSGPPVSAIPLVAALLASIGSFVGLLEVVGVAEEVIVVAAAELLQA